MDKKFYYFHEIIHEGVSVLCFRLYKKIKINITLCGYQKKECREKLRTDFMWILENELFNHTERQLYLKSNFV